MDTESKFCSADAVEFVPPVISPHVDDRSGPDSGRTQIMSSGSVPLGAGDGGVAGDGVEGVVAGDAESEDEARQPRLPHNPGRLTKREIAEHCVGYWPFRSRSRHCVCGRAAGSPHKARSDVDREFGRERIPTISLDHCFLGSADDAEGKQAHESTFLIPFDSKTAAIYALAVAEKACKPWC